MVTRRVDRTVNYRLKAATINATRPRDKPYSIADGGGLFVEVLPSGSRVWRYAYRINGEREKVTIGQYPAISITDARDRHSEYRAMVLTGTSPNRHLKLEKAAQRSERESSATFQEYAVKWVKETLFYRSSGYRAQVVRFLDCYINPRIGDRPLHDVKPVDVLGIMQARKHTPTTADRCRSIIQQVFKHAIRNLLVESNPAAAVRGAISVPPKTHHRHLNEKELSRFWKQVCMQHTAGIATVYAAKLLMLTMVRKSELRLAKWVEFDLDSGVWDIPKERMKMRQAHRVYLSTQSVGLLRELYKVSGHGEYLFPTRYLGGGGKPISDTALNHFFKRLDFGVPEFSPHGTRGTAATLLRENGFNRDVVELLLAHKEKDETVAAYTHAELASERREALQWLADRIDHITHPQVSESVQ